MVIFAWVIILLAALACTAGFLLLQSMAMGFNGKLTWEGFPLFLGAVLLWSLVVWQFPFTVTIS